MVSAEHTHAPANNSSPLSGERGTSIIAFCCLFCWIFFGTTTVATTIPVTFNVLNFQPRVIYPFSRSTWNVFSSKSIPLRRRKPS